MMEKNGQVAAGAAVLLVIIAGLIIMFVVLMPPAERAELLGEDTKETGSRASKSTGVSDDGLAPAKVVENLLKEAPGRIDYLAQREIEHPLPVVNIFTRTEAKVLAEKSRAYAKKGVFSEEISTLSFPVSDLKNTENAFLGFDIVGGSGKLIIYLNDEEIYDSPIDEGNIAPISLPKNNLQEQNKIVMKVSSPGIAFWVTNDATLKNIKVVADVTSIDAQVSRNIFLISNTEINNLEKIVLKFQPECSAEETGRLTITVNGEEIYSAVPDCYLALVPIEFSPTLVRQGENQIVFRTEKGSYMLSHIVLESKLKAVDFPTYYFDLSHEQFNEVSEGEKRVRLRLDFVDVVAQKYGDLVINGRAVSFDTKEVSYVIDLSDDVVQGNNALKIKPRKTLEIRELKVDLVK